MADETKGFGDFSQSIQGVSEQITQDQKALEKATKAVEADTRAIKANTQAREQWGRLQREQLSLYDKVVAKFTQLSSGLFSIRTQTDSLQRSISGFTGGLAQASSISAVYNRKLEAMRKGQKAYTQTLIASTNNTAEAMDKSQQYVTAVHDSYVSARRMAGEFRVEAELLQKATDELNSRFSTQIAVSGDMTGAIEGMRREAFVLGRYLGMEMTEVMDTWQERMNQSTSTLKEGRAEMIRVAHQADVYAQELQKLGDRMLKTGNIGKREFVQMVRDAAKQFRYGLVQVEGYSRALKGLLVNTKQMGLSADEQRLAAEGLSKTTQAMFTMGSGIEIFGLKAAQEVRKMWDDPQWLAQQDEQVQRRIATIKKRFAGEPEFVQTRAIMDAMRGSSTMSAMGMRMMASMTNLGLNREIINRTQGTGLLVADAIAEQIQSGEAATNMEKAAQKKAEQQRDEQTEWYKKSIEELVKTSMTPKNLEYKMYAAVYKIQQELHYYVEKFPYWIMAAQAGGSLLGLLGRGGGLMGRGGGLLGRLLGRGAAGAAPAAGGGGGLLGGAGGTLASATGAFALGAGAAAAGAAVGIGIDYGIGKIISSPDIKRKIGDSLEQQTASSYFAETAEGRRMSGLAMLDVFTGGDTTKKLAKIQAETVRIEGKVLQRRKEQIKALGSRIDQLKKYGELKTAAEEEELKELEKKRKAIKDSIKDITKREAKEQTAATKRFQAERATRVAEWMRTVQLTGKETPAEAARMMLEGQTMAGGPKGATALQIQHLTGDIGKHIMGQLAMLPEETRARFGDPQKFVEAVSKMALRRRYEYEGREAPKNLQDMVTAWNKNLREGQVAWTTAQQLRGADVEKLRATTEQQLKLDIGAVTGEDLGEQLQTVTVNARGQVVIGMPSQKLVLEGIQLAGAIKKTEQQNNP